MYIDIVYNKLAMTISCWLDVHVCLVLFCKIDLYITT